MYSETDKAYLAGLIDGEGSIGIDNHGGIRSPSIRITLTNTDANMLAELKAIWGGWLSARRKRKLGWKSVADLIWAGKPASKVLRAIEPYVKAKRKQCQLALQFNETVSSSYTRGVPLKVQTYRQELRRKMLELNKRGSQTAPTS